ncbi:hypothetical protein Tco_0133537 [Tanacetum coccineum]
MSESMLLMFWKVNLPDCLYHLSIFLKLDMPDLLCLKTASSSVALCNKQVIPPEGIVILCSIQLWSTDCVESVLPLYQIDFTIFLGLLWSVDGSLEVLAMGDLDLGLQVEIHRAFACSYHILKLWLAFKITCSCLPGVRGLDESRKDLVILDSEDSTVTYTEVSSLFEDLSDIGSPRVDGLPMMPDDPYVYVEAALRAPPSPDYMSGPEEPEQAPLLPDFVPKPVYPEFMPPEDDVLSAEEQPLSDVVLPTTDSPGYITESNPEEDPEEDPANYPDDRYDDDEE